MTSISSSLARELIDAGMPTDAVLAREAAEYISGIGNKNTSETTGSEG